MQTLKPYALDGNCMFPVYGLAEASLAVTFPSLEKRFSTVLLDRSSLRVGQSLRLLPDNESADAMGIRLVAVGRPVSDVHVMIRDDNNDACDERVTGRICIRGQNVTAGYFKEPELNAQMIDADGWLDTGDLGFMHEAQLYITGRAKDIIFIHGQNVYPHDLEEILIGENLIERGKLAIASHSDMAAPAEQLLVFVLHRTELSDLEESARDITRTLATAAGIGVDAVVAVPRIPKTTSGKVQRFELLQRYQAGEYQSLRQAPAIEAVVPADPVDSASLSTAERLLLMCNSHIEDMQLGLDDNLFELGISSLTLAEIHASIEDSWPDQVDITDLFDYPTVAELAVFLDAKN